jgi:hypothetical protein
MSSSRRIQYAGHRKATTSRTSSIPRTIVNGLSPFHPLLMPAQRVVGGVEIEDDPLRRPPVRLQEQHHRQCLDRPRRKRSCDSAKVPPGSVPAGSASTCRPPARSVRARLQACLPAPPSAIARPSCSAHSALIGELPWWRTASYCGPRFARRASMLRPSTNAEKAIAA